MPTIPTIRRLPRRLTAALALIALACALTLGAPLRAQAAGASAAKRSTCSSRTARSHASHASCVKHQTRKHKKSHRKPKAKHPAKGKSKKSAPAGVQVPATCEDGSTPIADGPGYTCDDGSEPACEDGSEPIASNAGGKPVCPTGKDGEQGAEGEGEGCEAGAGEGECAAPQTPVCEDSSAPIWNRDGYYDCRYGEPTCEAGSTPTFSSEGNILFCEAGEEAGED